MTKQEMIGDGIVQKENQKTYLPEELVINILSFLALKDLFAMKCTELLTDNLWTTLQIRDFNYQGTENENPKVVYENLHKELKLAVAAATLYKQLYWIDGKKFINILDHCLRQKWDVNSIFELIPLINNEKEVQIDINAYKSDLIECRQYFSAFLLEDFALINNNLNTILYLCFFTFDEIKKLVPETNAKEMHTAIDTLKKRAPYLMSLAAILPSLKTNFLAKLILNKVPALARFDLSESFGGSLIDRAVEFNNYDLVLHLLKNGQDINKIRTLKFGKHLNFMDYNSPPIRYCYQSDSMGLLIKSLIIFFFLSSSDKDDSYLIDLLLRYDADPSLVSHIDEDDKMSPKEFAALLLKSLPEKLSAMREICEQIKAIDGREQKIEYINNNRENIFIYEEDKVEDHVDINNRIRFLEETRPILDKVVSWSRYRFLGTPVALDQNFNQLCNVHFNFNP